MRQSVRTLMAASVVAALCTPGAVATLDGCTLQVCDPTRYWYDGQTQSTTATDIHPPPPFLPGSGVVDETTWQSGPIEFDTDAGDTSEWVDFPGQRTVFFFPNGAGQPVGEGPFPGPYTDVIAYVSADNNANDLGNNWTLAGGNLAEVTVHRPDHYSDAGADYDWFVAVTNATCAQYYLRVTIHRAAPDADAGAPAPLDAGREAGP